MKLTTSCRGPNHSLARLIAEELVRLGVDTFCVAPGNQSAPLVLALTEHSKTKVTVHFDERGAAFFALGCGKISGKPAAVITTSGSALANCYPAVVEADAAEVPLLIITADRLEALQDTGANQTFDQQHFFGRFVRWEHTITASTHDLQPFAVLTAVDQAVFRTQTMRPGAVHLNVRFARPTLDEQKQIELAPVILPRFEAWGDSDAPATVYHPLAITAEPGTISKLAERISQAQRGLIAVGSLSRTADKQAILALAEKLKWPLIADITSNLRFGPGSAKDLIFCHMHWYCSDTEFRRELNPDLILQFGAEPVQLMNNAVELVEQSAAYRVLINKTPVRQDPGAGVAERICAEPAELCRLLLPCVKENCSLLLAKLSAAESTARAVLEQCGSAKQMTELAAVRAVAREIPDQQVLVLGNSLPVRMATWCIGPQKKQITIACNRGLSGIDGTIATAIGCAYAEGKPVTLICGDQTLLYDLNSLALAEAAGVKLTVVVLNNRGGGIFSSIFSPQLGPDFHRATIAPHELTFADSAKQFGLKYGNPVNLRDFVETYRSALAGHGSHMIELLFSHEDTAAEIKRIRGKITDQLER